MFFVVVLLQLAFVTVPASVIFEDCGSAYELQNVDIEGCTMRLPCLVTLGENTAVGVRFRAGFDSRKLDQDVVININLINVSTPVTPEACEVRDCPVQTGVITSYNSIMSIPPRMVQNQRGFLRWRVYNEQGRLVLCYSVNVQTQSSLQKMLRAALSDTIPEDDLDDIATNIDLHDIDPTKLTSNASEGYLQELLQQYYNKRTMRTEHALA